LELGQPKAALVVSLVAGAAIWIVIALVAGVPDAWDDVLYWQAGYPVLAVVTAVCGYLAWDRPWRWALAAMTSQMVVMLVQRGYATLLPLGAIVFLVLALPLFAPAYLGAWLAQKKQARA